MTKKKEWQKRCLELVKLNRINAYLGLGLLISSVIVGIVIAICILGN